MRIIPDLCLCTNCEGKFCTNLRTTNLKNKFHCMTIPRISVCGQESRKGPSPSVSFNGIPQTIKRANVKQRAIISQNICSFMSVLLSPVHTPKPIVQRWTIQSDGHTDRRWLQPFAGFGCRSECYQRTWWCWLEVPFAQMRSCCIVSRCGRTIPAKVVVRWGHWALGF